MANIRRWGRDQSSQNAGRGAIGVGRAANPVLRLAKVLSVDGPSEGPHGHGTIRIQHR
jgi:hypothetical protein